MSEELADTNYLNDYINENYEELRNWVRYNEQVKLIQHQVDDKGGVNKPVMKYEDWQKLDKKCWG